MQFLLVSCQQSSSALHIKGCDMNLAKQLTSCCFPSMDTWKDLSFFLCILWWHFSNLFSVLFFIFKGFCVLLPPDTKATDVWITGYVATHVSLGIFDVGLLSNTSLWAVTGNQHSLFYELLLFSIRKKYLLTMLPELNKLNLIVFTINRLKKKLLSVNEVNSYLAQQRKAAELVAFFMLMLIKRMHFQP